MKQVTVACLVLLCLCSNVRANFVNGSVRVSSGAFAKIVKAARLVLVKFDDVYPYGDKLDEYKKVAEASMHTDEWLCVDIGVADYGEKENFDLAERYSVKKENFPIYLLFKNGDMEKPVRHTGSFKADDVKTFVSSEGGLYIGLSGCLEAFDKYAMSFIREEDAAKRQTILAQAQEHAAKLETQADKESGEFYVKTMQKVLEKPDFVDEEFARIKKLKDGKVSDKKRTQMVLRLNILTTFRNASLKKDEL